MSDDLDKYVEERWGGWLQLYASIGIDELVEELYTLNQELSSRPTQDDVHKAYLDSKKKRR